MDSKTKIYPARNIITMNAAIPEGVAVAVQGDIILGVGSIDDLKCFGPFELDTSFQDLFLIPGLIEAHSHIGEGTHWGFPYIGYYDRFGPDGKKWKGIKSLDEVIASLKNLDSQLAGADEPLVVWGFDPIFFEGERMNVSHLDQISKTRPIFVFHVSDHLATVNSALLKKMNITKETNVVGVARDSDGELNGELQEPDALMLAGDIYNRVADGNQIDNNWVTYGTQAKNAGCTTIAEMAYGSPDNQGDVDRLKRIIDDPDFPVRVNQLYLPLLDRDRPADNAAQWVIEQGRQSTGKLRMGIVKYFLDGSIQGFTARLKEPGYLNQQANGIWLTPPEEMAETLLAYHKHGLSMHCHCNGDEAVDVFLEAVERVQAEAYWPGLRHTIHHSQLTTAAQYQRMADLGICANIFANHIYYWGDQHAKLTVGPDRAQRMDACRTAGNMGVHYSLHSDAPITPINQLHSVWAAVNRLTASGNVMGENERISVYEALHAVTLDTAYTLKMDHEVGSIEPGKLADFTVLEENPFDVDPMKIRDIPIWGTVMGGRKFPAAR